MKEQAVDEFDGRRRMAGGLKAMIGDSENLLKASPTASAPLRPAS